MSTYNDVNVPYGSQVITLTAVAYVAENISLQTPSTIIERRNELGVPSGQVFIEGFGTGTATLQFATTLTIIPVIGATFSLVRNDATTIGCAISEVGEAYTQLDAKKCNVSFRRRVAS